MAAYTSTLNGSTTPLNSSSTFTGSWEDVGPYDSVVVAVKTDQNGTMQIQFSPDATNVDSTLTRYYRTDQIEPPHRFTITRRYMRVVFTNTSASNQTEFRLQTTVGEKGELNAPCDSVLAQDFDATVVRPTYYHYEVALGRRQGTTTWNKFGYNADVDTGTEFLAAQGGSLTILTSASTLTTVSSSTADDSGGTGTNSIVVYGVDANRDYQTETVTMDGTTNVVSTSTWLGINRVGIASAGSAQGNVGNITITATTGGSVQAYMPAGEGVTQQLAFFTRDSHQALADWMWLAAEKLGGGGTPKVTFKAWIFNAATNAKAEVFRAVVDTSATSSIELRPSHPFVIPENSVFWIEATTDTDNTVVSGRFSLIEARDVDAV